MARARAGRPVAGVRRNAIPPLRMSVKGLRWIVDPLGGRNANHGRVNASSGRSLRRNMGILRRASRLRRRATTGSIGMGDGLSPKSGWFGHAFPELSPRLPQGLPRPAPSVFGVPKKQKFRQAGQSPSGATFEKKKRKKPQRRPLRSDPLFENRRSPTQTRGGFRAARQAVGAARLAKPQFRRNASAARQAGLARRLSPAAARRAGRSRSRCGRAGAGAPGPPRRAAG